MLRKILNFPALALSIAMLPAHALAQAVGAEVDPNALPLDIVDLVNRTLAVFDSWKAGGAVAGLVSLTYLVVHLSKLKALAAFFNRKPWIRPLFSMVTGLALAVLGAVATGTAWHAAIIAGLIAGLTSSGFHELLNAFSASKQAERAIGAKMAELTKGDGEIETKISALKAELDVIVAMPTEKERLDALAAWAKAHPPRA